MQKNAGLAVILFSQISVGLTCGGVVDRFRGVSVVAGAPLLNTGTSVTDTDGLI